MWDGLGKQVKRQVIDAVAEGKFTVNLTVHVAIVGAMRARTPKKVPYGPRAAAATVTPYDKKEPAAADAFFYVILAKDAAEKVSMESTIETWRQLYTKANGENEFELDVILALDDTRDYKTIKGSSNAYYYVGRGDQKLYIKYCRRACGCEPCWIRDPERQLGAGCECPKMRGKWMKGNIVRDGGSGGAAETRADKSKTLEWIQSWKTGTYLAFRRVGNTVPTLDEMTVRSYNLSYVCGKAEKATEEMEEDGDHERVRTGQWFVLVQDLEVVNENNQTWKKVSGTKRTRCNVGIFHEVSDIKMITRRKGVLAIDIENHSELTSHWAASLNDD